MASRATITGPEAADGLAIRELIDAYAHCADRRDGKGQMALFTADTRFLVNGSQWVSGFGWGALAW